MESRCTHGSGYARRRRVFVALSMNEQLTQWIVFLDRFWVLKSRFYWGGLAPWDTRHVFQKFNMGRRNGKRLKALIAVWHAVV
jgi:hypothetical protein